MRSGRRIALFAPWQCPHGGHRVLSACHTGRWPGMPTPAVCACRAPESMRKPVLSAGEGVSRRPGSAPVWTLTAVAACLRHRGLVTGLRQTMPPQALAGPVKPRGRIAAPSTRKRRVRCVPNGPNRPGCSTKWGSSAPRRHHRWRGSRRQVSWPWRRDTPWRCHAYSMTMTR